MIFHFNSLFVSGRGNSARAASKSGAQAQAESNQKQTIVINTPAPNYQTPMQPVPGYAPQPNNEPYPATHPHHPQPDAAPQTAPHAASPSAPYPACHPPPYAEPDPTPSARVTTC